MNETRSTCPYCGVGCGVIIESKGAQVTGVRGDPDHPANFGRLCTKGQTLHFTAAAQLQPQVRALQPMRRAARGRALQPVTWDDTLGDLAARIAQVAGTHGPDAIGVYLSGQLLTEDYYVFNKLAKGLLGTNNVDTNSRLCMSSAVSGYKASLGADAPPACYDDLALARTVFITGSNMAWAHPVLYRRLEDARRANPGMKLIVADPRRTETAADADLHLPLLPGTDVVLYHAMLHLMLWEGLADHTFIAAHTEGFAALRDRVREFSPAHAAKVCGLKEADIVQAARWFAGLDGADGGADGGAEGSARHPTLSLWCQGLNQSSSGTDKNRALINLHLATGQIGKPGAGPLSLTGQPNAMGGREVGGLATQLSAHRDLADPAQRAEVAALWGVDAVPAAPGLAAVEMFQAAADGRLQLLWIVCTNPAQSLPDQALVRRALERCPFVVLQETHATTATVPYADLLLPAAGWGEKEGTVTNSERRISRVRAAVPAPGQARADWAIAVDVARRVERLRPPAGARGTLFPYESPQAVWNEHRESTRGRDLDITGLDYSVLEAAPRQWPYPAGAAEGLARLYTDGRFATADGRARFAAPAWRPTAEQRDQHYPVSLTTGRLRDQWHGGSRTGLLGRLFAHAAEPALQMHPQELTRRRWKAGDLVRVRSRRGALVLPVQPDAGVPPAQAFIAMHWGGEVLAGGGALGVNALLPSAVCPQSRQPELKHAAVRLESAALPWSLVAAVWLPPGQVMTVRARLHAHVAALPFASLVPFGREPDGGSGLLLRAAAAEAQAADWLIALQALLQLADGPLLRYDDPRAGRRRVLRLADDGTLQGWLLAGDSAAAGWLLEWLQQRQPAAAWGRALLAGAAQPPQAGAVRGPKVCSCHDVGEAAIVAALRGIEGEGPAGPAREASRLQALIRGLQCGTGCGSCLPALKALVRRQPAEMAETAEAAMTASPAPASAMPPAEVLLSPR